MVSEGKTRIAHCYLRPFQELFGERYIYKSLCSYLFAVLDKPYSEILAALCTAEINQRSYVHEL